MSVDVSVSRLVNEIVEDVVDLFADVCAESEELAVYPVKRRLEEVSLPRIFRVKQRQQLHNEPLVDELFSETRLEVAGLETPEH